MIIKKRNACRALKENKILTSLKSLINKNELKIQNEGLQIFISSIPKVSKV